jgi:thiamine biosynthesis lipoprotein
MFLSTSSNKRQHKTGSALLTLFLLWTGLLLVGCTDSNTSTNKQILRLSGATMGTSYNITLVVEQNADVDLEATQQAIDALLVNVNQAMSTYIPTSELSRLNDNQSGEWITLSESLYAIIKQSDELSRLSNGAFDVTIGPLIDLWGFGTASADIYSLPTDKVLEVWQGRYGYESLTFNDAQTSVKKLKPVRIDLSAIAKGHGVDVVSNYLQGQGFSDHLVEIGGELKLVGVSHRGTPWRIGVETPSAGLFPNKSAREAQRAISVSDLAVATSGDYRNYFEVDGVRYSHTIDPRTARPVAHDLVSVTVVAESAAWADGLATAFNVLGVEAGVVLADQLDIAALFITKKDNHFSEQASKAFVPYLNESEE